MLARHYRLTRLQRLQLRYWIQARSDGYWSKLCGECDELDCEGCWEEK